MTDKKTGAGAEASEGIHSADHPRTADKNTALENKDRQADGDERGSEPTRSHPSEHKSQYGGGGRNGGA